MASEEEEDRLWRDCVRWLVDANLLDRTHHLTDPSADMMEFANILRDGVLLCRLVNQLVPDSIDSKEINLRPQLSQFLCLKNICLFLGACQKVFGVKQVDMFEAWELYKLQDFGKVLRTLSKISLSETSRHLGLTPFYFHFEDSAFDNVVYANEYAIYRTLQEQADAVEPEEGQYDIYPPKDEEESGRIYDTIVCQRSDSQKERADPWESFQPSTKKEHCMKELIETEQRYTEKGLDMLVTKFYTPLKSHLDDEDCKAIFTNLTELWDLHHVFYPALRNAAMRQLNLETSQTGRPTSMPEDATVGDVFLRFKDKFTIYGMYCIGMPEAQKRINALLKRDTNIARRVQECSEAANQRQFSLHDLLSLPYQRILKYHLFLEQMVSKSETSDSDRRVLEDAREAMLDINKHVNEMTRDHEMKKNVDDIQRSITDLVMPDGLSLIDYGRLNKDGEVKLTEDGGRPKQRHVFIFDKVLLVCKALRNNQFTYKSAHILTYMRVEEGESTKGTISRRFGTSNFTFALVSEKPPEPPSNGGTDRAPVAPKTLGFSFKGSHLKEAWMNVIEKAKERVHLPAGECGTHRVIYTTVREVKNCHLCQKLFAGLFYQGYRCESCHEFYHRECLTLKLCMGRKESAPTPTLTPSSSFSSTRSHLRLVKGDRVQVIRANASPDPNFLATQSGDVLEVLGVTSGGLIEACFFNDRDQCGFVQASSVQRRRVSPRASLISFSDAHVLLICIAHFRLFTGNHGQLSFTPLRTVIQQMSMDEGIPGQRSTITMRKESTLLPRPAAPSVASPLAGTEYVNTEIASQPWYVGDVDRQEAERRLKGTPDGTFLVRYSLNKGLYAVSVSYEGDVKHMRVEQKGGQVFFDEEIIFNSIVELVNYYRENSLVVSFSTLNTKLKTPYRASRLYRAIHNYSAQEEKYLELKCGDIVELVDTSGEDRGWWKGQIENRVGFFPLSYVVEISNDA